MEQYKTPEEEEGTLTCDWCENECNEYEYYSYANDMGFCSSECYYHNEEYGDEEEEEEEE